MTVRLTGVGGYCKTVVAVGLGEVAEKKLHIPLTTFATELVIFIHGK